MKKLVVTLFLTITGIAAFAQGDFAFTGPGPRAAWDNFTTPGVPVVGATINVAFLFGSTSATPLVDSIYSKTTTNGTTTLSSAQITTAWSDILNDSSFMLATNDLAQGSPAVGVTSGVGAYAYTPPGGSAGGAFAVDGSASAGASYKVFIIGWSSAYATPQAAALAGGAVGWSQTFTYTAVAGPNPGPAGNPGTFLAAAGSAQPLQFGVIAPVPEPSTMALAALGGASLLLFRRRK